MSVTLEQWRALGGLLDRRYGCGAGVAAGATRPLLDTLRANGVRRENVRINTGSDVFAFNVIQQSFLPEMYRPPDGSYGRNVS
jgi:hypothetical protein